MAGKDEVKILGVRTSPYAIRVEIALKLKGVEYEYIPEVLSNKSELLLKSNPVHKKIPVLLHNGNPLPESLEIVEYIEDTWKGYPILPSDPHQRAVTRFWSKFIDKFVPGIFRAAFKVVGKEREQLIEESRKAFNILENELKGKNDRFFNGDSFGLVDIVGVSIAFWLPILQEAGGLLVEVNQDNYPSLHKWTHQILNHPVVKEALPPRDLVFGRAKAKFDSIAALK